MNIKNSSKKQTYHNTKNAKQIFSSNDKKIVHSSNLRETPAFSIPPNEQISPFIISPTKNTNHDPYISTSKPNRANNQSNPRKKITKETTQSSSKSQKQPPKFIHSVKEFELNLHKQQARERQRGQKMNTWAYIPESDNELGKQQNLLDSSSRFQEVLSTITPKYSQYCQGVSKQNRSESRSRPINSLEYESGRQLRTVEACMEYIEELLKEIHIKNEANQKYNSIIEQLLANNQKLSDQLSEKQRLIQQFEKAIQFLQQDPTHSKQKGNLTNNQIPSKKSLQNGIFQQISMKQINSYVYIYANVIETITDQIKRAEEEVLLDGFMEKSHSYQEQLKEAVQPFVKPSPIIKSVCKEKQSESVTIKMLKNLIQGYKKYCFELQNLLNTSVNQCSYLLQSPPAQKDHSLINLKVQLSEKVSQLVPEELIRVIAREIAHKIGNKMKNIKDENSELTQIVRELMGWIKKNLNHNQKELKADK